MEAALVVIFVASAAVAFAVGRWWTVLVPIPALGLFYAGLNADWWGHGVGDRWEVAMARVTAIAVIAAALGVVARMLVRSRAEPPVPA